MVKAGEAVISVEDRGFRYGDGAFETLMVQDGVPYQFEWHMARLAGGLSAIKIPFSVDDLHGHCRQLLKKNALKYGILRIQVTRGASGRGYLPGAAQPTFVIETSERSLPPSEAVSLWQSTEQKISVQALPVRYKLCQGLQSTLARIEAAEKQCFEALLLNEKGHVCETSSANLFWFKGGILYTPSLECGVLEGATRAAIMRLSPYPVHEVSVGIEALQNAEAVFITNTAWQVVAVNRLLPLGYQWDSVKITQRFSQLLADDRQNYCDMHREKW
jgi:branched-subunit amino acid aminotransferase/4-amino-4-deoxychorismate lyase